MNAPAPGWYQNPENHVQLRWWDGIRWTEQVQAAPPAPAPAASRPTTPIPVAPVHTPTANPAPRIAPSQATNWQQRSAAKYVGTAQAASVPHGTTRSPMTEQRLFVSQKRKLIELTNEYAVFGADGTQVGAVVEVGQSVARKAVRLLTKWDKYLQHTVEVRDTSGRPLLILTRPAKVFKSTVVVTRPDGGEIGRLVQRNVFGKICFGMESGGGEIGSLNAENWRAWNFAILDHTGTEVARITKTWEGLLTTMFTTADNYLVDIHRPLTDPMHSLVVAAALTVDTALKQDER